MNITQPFAEIWQQSFTGNIIENMLKHIERVGRVCYRSEDKITSDSYKKFINMLEKSNHGAMLEHGTIYMEIHVGTPLIDNKYIDKTSLVKFFQNNRFSVVNKKNIIKDYDDTKISYTAYYITTNYRVVVENNLKNDIIKYICKPTENHEKRYTVHFSSDIGVSREANRHRMNSVAESSTRYCNYSKDKFGGELNINQPAWITDEMINEAQKPYYLLDKFNSIKYAEVGDNDWSAIDWWLFGNKVAERVYLELINKGWKAQQARTILPLDTHTDLIHTAFEKDWKHFIDLRSLGTTGAPHPDMKKVADMLKKEFDDINE